MPVQVILNKISVIEHCIKRIQDVYANDPFYWVRLFSSSLAAKQRANITIYSAIFVF